MGGEIKAVREKGEAEDSLIRQEERIQSLQTPLLYSAFPAHFPSPNRQRSGRGSVYKVREWPARVSLFDHVLLR